VHDETVAISVTDHKIFAFMVHHNRMGFLPVWTVSVSSFRSHPLFYLPGFDPIQTAVTGRLDLYRLQCASRL
jgi:hypothetical protein